MKIAIFGAGGVGGYFGARLAEAGAEVSVITRGAHLAAIRKDGLRVLSPLGDALFRPKASDSPEDLGPADIVVFCVKLYDVEAAAARLAPLIGPETAVISLQNGVDAEDRIAAVIGAKHVAGGVAYISVSIESPGVIRHHARFSRFVFAERDNSRSLRLERLLAVCKKAKGMDVDFAPDIDKAIWEKFIMIGSVAATQGLTRLPLGPVMSDAERRWLLRGAMDEIEAVAKARGVRISPDAAAKAFKTAEGMPTDMKSSLLHDLEKGNRIEIEGLSGAVWRLGAATGVPTPIHKTAYAALKSMAGGRPV